MPGQTRNEKVSYAVSKALKQRGLTHKQVASLLNLALQTVNNKISLGQFKESEIAVWSTKLEIEPDIFRLGREPLPPNDYQAIKKSILDLQTQIDDLRQELYSLKRQHNEQ